MNEDDTDIPQQQQTSHKPGGEPKIKVTLIRVPTSSGNHGKPGKSLKKSMHGKVMEFEKT